MSCLFRSPWIPLEISVEDQVLEIAGLESRSGLKMGLSGMLGFAWNESRHVNSRGAFPTANVLVNLLKEETIKSLPTLVTRHLSRLVSGLEGGLLHRSIAHRESVCTCKMAPLKLPPKTEVSLFSQPIIRCDRDETRKSHGLREPYQHSTSSILSYCEEKCVQCHPS